MSKSIHDILTPASILAFTRKRKRKWVGIRPTLFPNADKIVNLTYSFLEINGVRPVVAKIHAFNAAPEVLDTPGFEKVSGELFKWHQAAQLGEEEIIRKFLFDRNNTTDEADAVRAAYDFVSRTQDGIYYGLEMMTNHMVCKGEYQKETQIGNQKQKTLIQYPVPENHQEILSIADNWDNPDHSILSDIERWVDVVPGRYALTDKKTIQKIQRNTEIQKTILGKDYNVGGYNLPTLKDINEKIMDEYDWPRIAAYEEPEEAPLMYGANGDLEEVKLFPEGYFVIMKTLNLGKTVWSKSAEEIKAEGKKLIKTNKKDFIFSRTYEKESPVQDWTESVAVAALAFRGYKDVFQAKVR